MPAARDIKGMVLKRMSISICLRDIFFFICTPTRLLQMFMIIFLKSVTRFESGLIGGGVGGGGAGKSSLLTV